MHYFLFLFCFCFIIIRSRQAYIKQEERENFFSGFDKIMYKNVSIVIWKREHEFSCVDARGIIIIKEKTKVCMPHTLSRALCKKDIHVDSHLHMRK